MKVIVTRESVAAGDDTDAPHRQQFTFADGTQALDIVARIVDSNYLAGISGEATWSVVSGIPIAVVAQKWEAPRAVFWRPLEMFELDVRSGVLYLHFNYHTQVDPDLVLEVLKRLKLKARA